ncbi:MAG TPA: LysM peptidoglycan-binding domain-containing protein [Bacillus sp. (in: firmicutes)]|nr:LysM peptidoglycan-binding domain-containing protein [Bacillus sp. (in: firmicutes)]
MKKQRWIYGIACALLLSSGGHHASAHKNTYIVKSGDTLWKIATANSVSVQNIKTWNNLTTDTIYAGQSLSLLAPHSHESISVAGSVHYVRAGETLYIISKKYGVTVDQLKQWNRLTSDMIYVGQKLQISATVQLPAAAPAFLKNGIFPLKKGTYTPFTDTWGESRQYGGDRTHEGTDIFVQKGTPVYSATSGIVTQKGWSELGGWRLTVRTNEGYYLYYAHLNGYAANVTAGMSLQKGQLIGYTGDSGYGPAGTTGKFVPHLHFGMYNAKWEAINPYLHLKYWESLSQ